MTRKIISLIYFFQISLCIGFASPTTEKERKAVESKKDTIELTEGQAYKMLYENQVKANDSILKTIYYALGALGTAIILVFGGNWVFNTKKVEAIADGIDDKIESLKSETFAEIAEKLNAISTEKTYEINQIQVKLQEEITLNIKDTTIKFNTLAEDVRKELRDENKALSHSFDERIKNFSDNLSMQIKTIETLTNERNENVNQKITSFEHSYSEKLKANKDEITSLKSDISKNIVKTEETLKASIYRNAGYMWETREVYSNAIMSFALEGKINLDNKNDINLGLALNDIARLLPKIKTIDTFNLNLVTNLINSLPVAYTEKNLEITELLSKIEKPA